MSEKLDIFTLLPLDAPYFDVDTTKLAVPMQRPSLLAVKMYAPGGLGTFQAGDNFTVMSAGYVLPEAFSLASAPANLQQTCPAINLGASSIVPGHTATQYFPNFGLSGIQLPLENYETPLGVFVDMFNVGSPNYYFRTEQYNLMATLRGLDETQYKPALYDPTPGLPNASNTLLNVVGDVYKATETANGWTENGVYIWDGSAWTLTGTGALPMISMVGVPASLNGRRMRITVFAKILHTLAIS